MKKIKYFYSKIQYEFLLMPKILQIVLAILLILCIYQMISIYFVQVEINENRIEYEKLKLIN